MIENTDRGFVWIDNDFRVVRHNKFMARYGGKSSADFIGHHCYEIFRNRVEICPGCPGKLAMDTLEPVFQELKKKLPVDGKPQIRSIAFPNFDKNGSVMGFLLVQGHSCPENDTDRDTFTESNQRLRHLADSTGCMAWLSNLENEIIYFNNAWLKYTGRTLAQELGNGWTESVHPDDLPHCLATGEAALVKRDEFRIEYRLRRSDGSYGRLLSIASPRFSPEGFFAGYLGICVDISEYGDLADQLKTFKAGLEREVSVCTASLKDVQFALKNEIAERRQIEEKLLNQQEVHFEKQKELNHLFHLVEFAKREWESTMDCVKEVVVLVDNVGRIRRCNKALVNLTGKGYADLIGTEIHEVFGKGNFPVNVLSWQADTCYEIDGRWFLVNSYLLDEGRIESGSVITLYDYTSLKQLTCKLEESNRNLENKSLRLEEAYEELKTTQVKIFNQEKMATIGQLAAGVAHEINNPIGFISSNLRTLNKYLEKLTEFIDVQSNALQAAGNPEFLEEVTKARKELKPDFIVDDIVDLIEESLDGAERVRKIVQDLKTFSRVDGLEWKMADLVEGLESTINMVWSEIKYKANLIRDFSELPLVRCYPHQLNQVFMNLLINAAQAIDHEGHITVKAWQYGEEVLFSFADDGCGIPAENLSKIFEPFFTTKEIGIGTGLGLSLSYEIVKKHKGEIFVESEQGKGTTFTVRLPIDVRMMTEAISE